MKDIEDISISEIDRAAGYQQFRTPGPGGRGYLLRPHLPHVTWATEENDGRICIYEQFSVWSLYPPPHADDPLMAFGEDPADNEHEAWFLHGIAPGRVLCTLDLNQAEGLARSLLGLVEEIQDVAIEMLEDDE